MKRITIINAGLTDPSSTRALAQNLGQRVIETFETIGEVAEVKRIDLHDHAHAIMDVMLGGPVDRELAEAIEVTTNADALIAATPTYLASFSGLFKSFFDIIKPDSLRGMPIALVATGGTNRHSLMLEYSLRPLFSSIGAHAVRTGVFAGANSGEEEAAVVDERLGIVAKELCEAVQAAAYRYRWKYSMGAVA